MTTTSNRVVADLDINGERWQTEPLQMESEARAAGPVVWTESNGGHWLISHYDEVVEGLRDSATYSAAKFVDEQGELCGGVMIPTMPFFPLLPNEADPPDWNVYRAAISRQLSPTAVEAMQPLLDTYVTEVIDHMIESGEADFVMQVGSPITALIAMHLVGLPAEDWHMFAEPIHLVYAEPEAAGPGMEAIVARLEETIAARKTAPQSGMIDDLIAFRHNGEPLPDDIIRDLILDVLVGGIDTVAGLMAGTLKWLEDKPEIRRRLVEDREFLKSANEEFLRYITPATGLARTATTDYMIGEQEVKAGDRLYFMYRSANWDEKEFDNPAELDLERKPNRHLAFGSGIHRCVGSNLARAVFQTVIPEFLARIPEYQIVESQQYEATKINAGFVKLAMRFQPGARVRPTRIFDHI